jgi:hypothetical protein
MTDVETGEVVRVGADDAVRAVEGDLRATQGVLDRPDERRVDLDRGQRDDVVRLVAHAAHPAFYT